MALLSSFQTEFQLCLLVQETRSVRHHSGSTSLHCRIDKPWVMDCTVDRRVSLGFLAQASPTCELSLLPPSVLLSSCSCSSPDRGHQRRRDESCLIGRRGAVFLHPKNCQIPWNTLIDSSLQLVEPGEQSSRPQARPPITVRKGVTATRNTL